MPMASMDRGQVLPVVITCKPQKPAPGMPFPRSAELDVSGPSPGHGSPHGLRIPEIDSVVVLALANGAPVELAVTYPVTLSRQREALIFAWRCFLASVGGCALGCYLLSHFVDRALAVLSVVPGRVVWVRRLVLVPGFRLFVCLWPGGPVFFPFLFARLLRLVVFSVVHRGLVIVFRCPFKRPLGVHGFGRSVRLRPCCLSRSCCFFHSICFRPPLVACGVLPFWPSLPPFVVAFMFFSGSPPPGFLAVFDAVPCPPLYLLCRVFSSVLAFSAVRGSRPRPLCLSPPPSAWCCSHHCSALSTPARRPRVLCYAFAARICRKPTTVRFARRPALAALLVFWCRRHPLSAPASFVAWARYALYGRSSLSPPSGGGPGRGLTGPARPSPAGTSFAVGFVLPAASRRPT